MGLIILLKFIIRLTLGLNLQVTFLHQSKLYGDHDQSSSNSPSWARLTNITTTSQRQALLLSNTWNDPNVFISLFHLLVFSTGIWKCFKNAKV